MFQAGAGVQAGAAAAAKVGTLHQMGPGNEVSRKCNGENRPGFIAEFSDSQVGKMLVRFEPGGICVRPCARAALYSETISSTTAWRASPSLSPSSTWAAGAGAATCGIDRSWLRRTTI